MSVISAVRWTPCTVQYVYVGQCQRRYAGDRAIPACSNCRKARPPLDCVFRGIKIRHSSYSAKVRATRLKETVNILPPGPHVDDSSQLPGLVHSVPAGSSASKALESNIVDSIEPAVTTTATASWVQNSSPSSAVTPDSLPGANSISSRTIPGSFDQFDNVSSPSLGQRALSVTSPSSVFSHRRHPSSQSRRMVTDDVERFVFEFYINHAGPWVRLRELV